MEFIKRIVTLSGRRGRSCCLRRSVSNAAAAAGPDRSTSTASYNDKNENKSEDGPSGSSSKESEATSGWERRVVSGLQPTGALHLGNYWGALRRCVAAQDHGDDLALFVADLHALTTQHEARVSGDQLAAMSLDLAATALAAGVDPARSILFVQSAVPRHAELCWVLACLCSQARVFHLPQYKEKAAKVAKGGGVGDGSEVPLGLLLYPVLQAADVLVLRGTHVPAGADQLQHLQLAAQLARTFAHRYGPAFPAPRAMLPDAADGSERIRSLREPTRKMSKSDRDRRAAILLTDSDQDIRDKIRKAVTDCTPNVTYEPETRPGVANLITLHCLAADKLPEEVVEESAGLTTAQYKREVAEALCTALRPVREQAAQLRERPRLVRDVLRDGAARARARADHTYECVARLVGLTPRRAPDQPRAHLVRLPPAPAPAPAHKNKPCRAQAIAR